MPDLVIVLWRSRGSGETIGAWSARGASGVRVFAERDESQGRWLINHGLVERKSVRWAWGQRAAGRGRDLCELLEQAGLISPEHAAKARQSSETAPPLAAASGGALNSPVARALRQPSAAQPSPRRQPAPENHAEKPDEQGLWDRIAPPGYEVLGELGRGSMGVVLDALQEGTGAPVVIKVIQDEHASERKKKRFRREALALAELRHENVVRIKSYGEHHERPYIIMEKVPGRSLEELIQAALADTEEGLGFERIARIFGAIADALVHCHEHGVIHRDLKPPNILVDEDLDRPVLVDFGLVKLDAAAMRASLSSEEERLTRTGTAVGTPSYMAPEQVTPGGRFGSPGPALDVWGLGGTLFFCLTGEPPTPGKTVPLVLSNLMKADPKPPSSHRSNIPRWLDELCKACLQRDSRRRPSMAEVRDSLRAASARSVKGAARPEERRMKALLGIGLPLCALLLAGLGYALQDRSRPELQLDDLPSHTGKSSLEFEARVIDNAPAAVIINGTEVKLRPGGRLVHRLKLQEGANRFELRAKDASDNLGKAKIIEVFADWKAPQIKLAGLPTTSRPLLLEGELSEDGCQLSAGKREAKVTGRSFTLDLGEDLSALRGGIVLNARDAAGNLTRVELPLRIVDPKGRGTHASIRQALNGEAGMRILVRPGRYRETLQISKPVEIIGESLGAGEPTAIVQARAQPITFALKDGSLARLSGIGFEARQSPKILVSLNSGAAEFRSCRFAGQGRVLLMQDGGRGVLIDCRFRRDSATGIIVRKGELKIRGGLMEDGSIPRLGNYRLETSVDASIAVLKDASVHIEKMRVNNSRDRAILAKDGGRAKLINCKIRGSSTAFAGVTAYRGSSVELRGGQIKGFQSAAVSSNASQLHISDMELKASSSTGVTVRQNASAKLERVTIRGIGSQLEPINPSKPFKAKDRGHWTPGVGLRVSRGKLELRNCRIEDCRLWPVLGFSSQVRWERTLWNNNGIAKPSFNDCQINGVPQKPRGPAKDKN